MPTDIYISLGSNSVGTLADVNVEFYYKIYLPVMGPGAFVRAWAFLPPVRVLVPSTGVLVFVVAMLKTIRI